MSETGNKKRLPFKPTALRKAASPEPTEKAGGEDDDLALFKRSREMRSVVAKEAERRAQREKAERDMRRRRRPETDEEDADQGSDPDVRSPGSSQKKRRTSGVSERDEKLTIHSPSPGARQFQRNPSGVSQVATDVSSGSFTMSGEVLSAPSTQAIPDILPAGASASPTGPLTSTTRILPDKNDDDDDLVILSSSPQRPTKVEEEDLSITGDHVQSSFHDEEDDPELQKYVQDAQERKRRLEEEQQLEQAGIKKNFTVEVISTIPNTHLAGPCLFKHFADDPLKQRRVPHVAGNRLYNTTTLQGLNISVLGNNLLYSPKGNREGFSDDRKRVVLEAWTEELFDEHQQEKERERQRLLGELDDEEEDAAPAPEPEERIKVTMRPKQGESVKVSVTASSSVSALIEKFRAKRHIPVEVKISIHFDGETLGEQMTLEDADIGDEDQVEVHMG
ncbi:unnamed protein product [Parascedosporium putredinis]|uniref:Ubiquitin-like domain-containing protein n=1 Tax=Parascedosporium putredinis TaxID=1442378 RepID=A0A9P1H6G6_9PEZI|nr:unnamed protein product [Parascedosporium putredinis]CAI7997636.1 unnamed protein product [Parascedosporium putredinis]